MEMYERVVTVLSTLLFIGLILTIFLISGCSLNDAISENIKEENFNQGCKVVHANTTLGYMSQSGSLGVPCKLKCSKELPPSYCFKYDSKTPYGNCNVSAGSGCFKQENVNE